MSIMREGFQALRSPRIPPQGWRLPGRNYLLAATDKSHRDSWDTPAIQRGGRPSLSSLSAKCWLRIIHNIRDSTHLLQRFPLSQQHYTDVTIIPVTLRKPGARKLQNYPRTQGQGEQQNQGSNFRVSGTLHPCALLPFSLFKTLTGKGRGGKREEHCNYIAS